METPPIPQIPQIPPVMPPEQLPPEQPRERQPEPKKKRVSSVIIVALLLVCLIAGGLVGYAISYSSFNSKLTSIQNQLAAHTQGNTFNTYPNATYIIGYNASLSTLYAQVKSSVVLIEDLVPTQVFFLQGYSQQQGSGFITSVNNQLVIVTNNHVVLGATNITVTFANGATYPGTEIGSDPKADLAVLTINPMPSGLTPLTLVSSDSLLVGQPVVAVGSPYGLQGTLTTGVISSLERTLTETGSDNSAGPTIPDTIQTSTAINPGNSGGPLLDYAGEVVGITTAAVSNSQGLGFAIPSATIMRELSTIVSTGAYNNHPSIDVTGVDMSYEIAQAMHVDVTYGYLVESVSTQNGLKGGTTQVTILGQNVVVGGDIIIGINGTPITNTDSLLSYIERNALPGQAINFTVVRDKQTQTVAVTIGTLT
ncbi:MAG: trypsin-like peptidase domain-containing protein [Candidatus Bathyarchaeia archaeon]